MAPGIQTTRRARLMATLRGEPVDRPPVNFYELNGYDQRPNDRDPLNIYSHPSWAPLLELTRAKTDRIVMRHVPFVDAPPDPMEELSSTVYATDGRGTVRTTKRVRVNGKTLTSRSRRDPDVNTIWQIEPLLKSEEDVHTWLDIPPEEFGGRPDTEPALSAERDLGDTGIVMIDTPDPVCAASSLFGMDVFLLIAASNPPLLHRILDRFAAMMQPRIEAVAKALPGRLWRIFGPEYVSPPYLHPKFFQPYVVDYDRPMVEAIQRRGGYARIHCHGKIRALLDGIASTGCLALDPIEPPPQGDVELAYVRERYGQQMVLFGNLEACDIENLPTAEFEIKVRTAIAEGTAGEGRGFVLMPSACPYGRELPLLAMKNYEKIVEVVEEG